MFATEWAKFIRLEVFKQGVLWYRVYCDFLYCDGSLKGLAPYPGFEQKFSAASRVSTEVVFLLPAEYGIFWKTYGIPPDSAEFRGIYTVKFTRNSAEFRVYLFTEFRR